MQDNEYRSICLLLHAAIQFEQHLLKILSLPHPVCISGFLVKNQMSKIVCELMSGYSIQFHSIVSGCMPMPCCFHYCSSVVQFEVRDNAASSSSFIIQDCLSYTGVFVFTYGVKHFPFNFCEG